MRQVLSKAGLSSKVWRCVCGWAVEPERLRPPCSSLGALCSLNLMLEGDAVEAGRHAAVQDGCTGGSAGQAVRLGCSPGLSLQLSVLVTAA